MYQLYELRDELKKAKNAILAKEEDERELVKTIFEAKKDQRFANLIKGLSEGWKNTKVDIARINTQIDALNRVIALHEKQDESSELANAIVSDVLIGLGAVYHEEKEK